LEDSRPKQSTCLFLPYCCKNDELAAFSSVFGGHEKRHGLE
jgi:hypothetical protein